MQRMQSLLQYFLKAKCGKRELWRGVLTFIEVDATEVETSCIPNVENHERRKNLMETQKSGGK